MYNYIQIYINVYISQKDTSIYMYINVASMYLTLKHICLYIYLRTGLLFRVQAVNVINIFYSSAYLGLVTHTRKNRCITQPQILHMH